MVRKQKGGKTRIGWVRGLIDIPGNEAADSIAKQSNRECRGVITGENLKAEMGELIRAELNKRGYRGWRRASWRRGALTAYTWGRTEKGAIGAWLHHIGKLEHPWYPTCGEGTKETGVHIIF